MIELSDVFYTYPNGFEALRGVDLTIERGEFVAVMGENGAGKTTMVKLFNGLLKPTRGTVTVDDVKTTDVSVAQLSRKVGLVFQNPDHQLFSETVEEEVSFALRNFGFDDAAVKKRTAWALSLLDLARYEKTSPFALSGGERKRVALASVLVFDPDYLVLDEPTIGQDYAQKERLRQFVIQLNQQGKAVVIVTHDVEFVAQCKPRVVLMTQGRVIADQRAEEVLASEDLIAKASLVMPQMARLFSLLKDLDFPRNVLDEYEAKRLILEFRRRNRHASAA
ncbi:MAG: ABC transporter ATP-binding protein [Candidatus Bathyarchaeia archaeon]